MNPIFIRVGHFQVTSYVALLALAGVISLLYFRRFKGALGLPEGNSFWFLVNVIGISGVLGGRLLDMLSHPRAFAGFADFLTALTTNKDGFSTFGVLGGVLLGVFYSCRTLKMDFFRTLDYVCLVIPVGHGIARIGCFLNGCCYGCAPKRDLPWAVIFTNPAAAVPADMLGVPLHPTQLYEATGDALLAGVLYFLVLPRVEKGGLRRGLVAVGYFAGYGTLRFINEYFNGSLRLLSGTGVTTAQIFSLVIMLLAATFLFVAVTRKRTPSSSAAIK